MDSSAVISTWFTWTCSDSSLRRPREQTIALNLANLPDAFYSKRESHSCISCCLYSAHPRLTISSWERHKYWGHIKRNLHKEKTSTSTDTGVQQQSAPYPGRVADMLSKMHLHCCRRWSFQIRAVPSRLPLTNLRQDSSKHFIHCHI